MSSASRTLLAIFLQITSELALTSWIDRIHQTRIPFSIPVLSEVENETVPNEISIRHMASRHI